MLNEILKYKRPHGSQSEADFIKKYIDFIPGIQIDGFGNRYILIGETDENRTIFTAHTDTVHHSDGLQKTYYEKGIIRAWESNCLGADDGAGIYLMLVMIKHNIPGLYVFHRAEEVGGQGSNYFVQNHIDIIINYDRVISFDRMGADSIITHQGYRTASNQFANCLADQLTICGLDYFPDDTGVFTDSANYADVVPECTNISVGYYNQHQPEERQDVDFIKKLANVLPRIRWAELPIVRNPYEMEKDNYNQWIEPEYISFDSVDSVLDYIIDSPQAAAELLFDLTQ